MERYIFTFTACICIIHLIRVIGIIVGNSVSYPKYGSILDPTSFLFLYPSMFWQVYYWSQIIMIH